MILVYEFAHDLSNDLRLEILRNLEILQKSQISVETEPSAQFLSQKLNFCNSSQKIRQSRYQSFVVLSNYIWFLYFIPNILSKIRIILDDHTFPKTFDTFFEIAVGNLKIKDVINSPEVNSTSTGINIYILKYRDQPSITSIRQH